MLRFELHLVCIHEGINHDNKKTHEKKISKHDQPEK